MSHNNEKKDLAIGLGADEEDKVDFHLMEKFSSEIQKAINPILDELESDARLELVIVLLSAAAQTAISLDMEEESLLDIVSSMLDEYAEMEDQDEDDINDINDISQLN